MPVPLCTIDPSRLTARRVELGLSRAEVAARAGVSPRMIFFYEEGTGRFDTIPGEVWIRVRTVLADRAMTRNQLQLAVGTRSRGDLVDDISPSRSRLARIAEVLEDPRLKSIAASDVFWDTIGSIKSNGNSVV